MRVLINRKMIDKAVLNVNHKLAERNQTKRIYAPNAKENEYYINNVVGELGELVFAKAVNELHRELGIDPHMFEPFMNSDVCDFYSSKSGKTIDVKTVFRENRDNLIVSKSIADWRPMYVYVLVKLISDEIEDLVDIYRLREAEILGSMTDDTVRSPSNVRKIHGKEVYFINKERLSPIDKFVRSHFYRKGQRVYRYHSEGTIRLEVASFESGTYGEDKEVDKLANFYANRNDGRYNFMPMELNGKIVSFAIHKGRFNSGLFIKALIKASSQARALKKTLVIPSYIESFIHHSDYENVVNIIENLKCEVEYLWRDNSYY